jgi:hypothetical protein
VSDVENSRYLKTYFEQTDFSEGTKKTYVDDLTDFCSHFRRPFDEIIELVLESTNPREQLKNMIKEYTEANPKRAIRMHARLSPLYGILRANGVSVDRSDIDDINRMTRGLRFRRK